jgi:NAD+ kinase
MAQRKAILVARPDISRGLVGNVSSVLQAAGINVQIVADMPTRPLDTWCKPVIDPATEIVVVLGGDGTILGAAELVKSTDIPILGVNMGHVGFLAEFESFQLKEAIARIVDRDYHISRRTLADVKAYIPGRDEPLHDWALNEATIEKAERGRMVSLGVAVDGQEISSYAADGLILSTPTGSTAYAFSAHGPVIWPDADCLELVPLAAHALFARPLILGPRARVRVGVLEGNAGGWLTCDGRRGVGLPVGSRVVIQECKDRLAIATLSEVPFSRRLVSKFHLPVTGWRQRSARQTGEPSVVASSTGSSEAPGRTVSQISAQGKTSPSPSSALPPQPPSQGGDNAL